MALPTSSQPLPSAPLPMRLPVPTHDSPNVLGKHPSLRSTASVSIQYYSYNELNPHGPRKHGQRQRTFSKLPLPLATNASANLEIPSGLLLRSSTPIPLDTESGSPVIFPDHKWNMQSSVPIGSSPTSPPMDTWFDIQRERRHVLAPSPSHAILGTISASNVIMSEVQPSTWTPPPAVAPSIIQLAPRPATVPPMSMQPRPLPSLPVQRPSVQVAPDNPMLPIADIVSLPCVPSPSMREELCFFGTDASSYDSTLSFLESASSLHSCSSVPVDAHSLDYSCAKPHTIDHDPEQRVQIPKPFKYSILAGSLLLGPGSATAAPASLVTPPTRPTPIRTPQILKFSENGGFSGLLYHSPHCVEYQDELYPTALPLFEARKFVDHRPDLAERIRLCKRIEGVTAVSMELTEFMRWDWNNVALDIICTGFIASCTFLADRLIDAGHVYMDA